MTIAIDGPVGAGKSSIAAEVARRLGVLHLDTGAMYRAMALKALRLGIDPHDAEKTEALCAATEITVALGETGQRTLLDGEDVTDLIRTPEVTAASSAISTVGAVRRHMVALQQACAAKADMVLDGRDIGTRVLPEATFKFYLTASAEVRAKRRYQERIAKGESCSFEEILRAVIERDAQDMNRKIDPLRRADDAAEVDSTAMTFEAVVEHILGVVREGKA